LIIVFRILTAALTFSEDKPLVSVVLFNVTSIAEHDAVIFTILFETELVNTSKGLSEKANALQ
ncbi:unnamed protein product, partial [marine sediment metagenome]